MDYNEACKQAATNQGLDPLTEALDAKGVTHGVAQTGGFCMAITVPHDEGVWAITHDGEIFAVWFPGTSWHDGPGEEVENMHEVDSIEEMLELVSNPKA